MKILIIGGYGTIGKHVVNALVDQHELIIASRSDETNRIDISDINSIKDLLEKSGRLDAIVCIAGEAKWDYMNQLSEKDYYIGLRSKLMGQVNLSRLGLEYLEPDGSITLSTGVLSDDPVPMTTSAAMVNGAIHSFVKAASLELKEGKRINAVCSGLVEDSAEKYKDYFPGHNPVPMNKVVNAYIKSIFGKGNGDVIRVIE